MARTRTAADNHAFWLARADEYDREATKARNPNNKQVWQQRAAEAREKAQQYLSPAPSEAESPQ